MTEPADGLARRWLAPFPLDLGSTLGVHRRGRGDPAFRADESGAIWRTSLTPAGPGTLRLTARPAAAAGHAGGTTEVAGTAWGPGADWLLAELPAMLGELDRPEDFRPAHPLLRELAVRYRRWRIGRSSRVLEALVPAVLEQKVVGIEARRAWRLLLTRFGEPAPGPAPAGLRVFPAAEVWAGLPSWEWHRAGVESVRARTIAAAAAVAGRLEEITAMSSAQADARLRSLPGIGPWTSAETRQRACGDADAVSVGDYHLPSFAGWALAGRITDDAGMLELLAPYRGHRYRVTRLIEMSGVAPPRRGPRLAARDYRAL
ncbi:MAG TPA: DNA-3-methyladenine glycosylase 2 family protein [Streptosporangiaceae bacterium]